MKICTENKKQYVKSKLEVIYFEASYDVITTSSSDGSVRIDTVTVNNSYLDGLPLSAYPWSN